MGLSWRFANNEVVKSSMRAVPQAVENFEAVERIRLSMKPARDVLHFGCYAALPKPEARPYKHEADPRRSAAKCNRYGHLRLTESDVPLRIGMSSSLLPPRSTAGQLTLDQHIGVRIPGGQPIKIPNKICGANDRSPTTAGPEVEP